MFPCPETDPRVHLSVTCMLRLVRAVTPEGSMGKVFGFVSTGLNLGGAITPVFFGWLMDQGEPRLLFWFSPVFMLLATVTVLAARFSRPKEAANLKA